MNFHFLTIFENPGSILINLIFIERTPLWDYDSSYSCHFYLQFLDIKNNTKIKSTLLRVLQFAD